MENVGSVIQDQHMIRNFRIVYATLVSSEIGIFVKNVIKVALNAQVQTPINAQNVLIFH